MTWLGFITIVLGVQLLGITGLLRGGINWLAHQDSTTQFTTLALMFILLNVSGIPAIAKRA